MTALLDGIKQNDFIIVGRAGIDFFTDPGVMFRREHAEPEDGAKEQPAVPAPEFSNWKFTG